MTISGSPYRKSCGPSLALLEVGSGSAGWASAVGRTPAAASTLMPSSRAASAKLPPAAGLAMKSTPPPSGQCLDGRSGAPLSERTDHDNRRRAFGHDSSQRRQPIHARHLDVQSHYVRVEGCYLDQRLQSIVGASHHDDAAISFQVAGDGMVHKGRVVHHQDADELAPGC